MREKMSRGSFTVEAACLMSLILLVIMGCISLFFHVHNRVWLTAATYESAVTGSLEGTREDGSPEQAAESKSQELGNIGFFGAENLRSQVSVGKSVQVTYTLDTVSDFGGFSWNIKTEGKSLVIRPVPYVWKIKAAAEILKGDE